MNCRACRGLNASPFTYATVWSRRDRTASTSSARTSSKDAPSRGISPRRPSRAMSSSLSLIAWRFSSRTSACSSRARPRTEERNDWAPHSSFLFFSPYFAKSSFSDLMRSASHGWEGREYFFRGNFGSPKPSLLLLLLLPAAGLFFLLGGLGGLDCGLLLNTHGEARAAVRARALAAHLLALLVPHALVRPDHLHAVHVAPSSQVHVRAEHMVVVAGVDVILAVQDPRGHALGEGREDLLHLFGLSLREIADTLTAGDLREARDNLRYTTPDALHLLEGVDHGARAVEVRVREPDDVPEVLLRVRGPLHGPRGARGGGAAG